MDRIPTRREILVSAAALTASAALPVPAEASDEFDRLFLSHTYEVGAAGRAGSLLGTPSDEAGCPRSEPRRRARDGWHHRQALAAQPKGLYGLPTEPAAA
jgi:hypothetical protein